MAHQLFPPLGCLREGRKPGMLPDTPLGDSNSTMPEEPSKKSPAPAFADDHPALDLAAALLRVFGRYGLSTDKRSAEELDTLRAVGASFINRRARGFGAARGDFSPTRGAVSVRRDAGKTVELSLLSGQAACLLMVDVDDFKGINDSHGHQPGDAVIAEMAQLLLRNFPRKTDFVAGYASDEFVVILQDTTAKEGRLLGERLLKGVRGTRIGAGDGELRFSVSMGVGASMLMTRRDLLRRADEALYAAKQTGRDRVHMPEGE